MASKNRPVESDSNGHSTDLGPVDARTVGFAAPATVEDPDVNISDGDIERGGQRGHGRGNKDTAEADGTFSTLASAAKTDRPNLGLENDAAWRSFPVLMGYLCKQQYHPGRSRKASRCSLYATETGFVLMIPDEGMNKKLPVKFDSLLDLLSAAEAALRDNQSRWAVLGYGEAHNRLKAEETKDLAKKGLKL